MNQAWNEGYEKGYSDAADTYRRMYDPIEGYVVKCLNMMKEDVRDLNTYKMHVGESVQYVELSDVMRLFDRFIEYHTKEKS